MRWEIIFKIIVFAVLLGACASAPLENSPPVTATATLTPLPSATDTPQPTNTPTPMPTPIGGGGYPLLAVVRANRVNEVNVHTIEILELETERTIATIPLDYYHGGIYFSSENKFAYHNGTIILKFSPDGSSLAYSRPYSQETGQEPALLLYDLQSGETRTLSTLPANSNIEGIQWSFDGKWLGYFYTDGGLDKLGIYSLERDRANFISSVYWAHWYPEENLIMYQNAGGSTPVLNVETGTESAPPRNRPSFSYLSDFHNADISNAGCGLCFIPKLGLFEQDATTRDRLTEFYNLIDPETLEIVFSAAYARPNPSASLFVLDLFRIAPDNFLLYIKTQDWEQELPITSFSAWNSAGGEVLEVTNADHYFENTMPLAFSPDGNSFLAVIVGPSWLLSEPIFPQSVAVFDLTSGEVLYEYNKVDGIFLRQEQLRGIAVFWPAQP